MTTVVSLSPGKEGQLPKYPWREIRLEWEAGIATEALARKYGCSPKAIRIRVKKEDWSRDLRAMAQRATERALLEGIAAPGITPGSGTQDLETQVEADARVVAQVATARAQLVNKHRTIARASLDMVVGQLQELRLVSMSVEELREYAEVITSDDANGKRLQAFMKAISLGERAVTVRNLMMALKIGIAIERQSAGLPMGDAKDTDEDLRKARRPIVRLFLNGNKPEKGDPGPGGK